MKSQIHTIKLDSAPNQLPTLRGYKPADQSHVETRALVALLGGYNSNARDVDVDVYHAIEARFKDTITELAGLMDKSKPNRPVTD